MATDQAKTLDEQQAEHRQLARTGPKNTTRFFSKRSRFTISAQTKHVPVERGGRVIYKELGQPPVEFKNGVFTTRDSELVDMLKDHPAYGIDFWQVGDEPEQAETASGHSVAPANARTSPVTPQQAGAAPRNLPEPSRAEKVQRFEEATRVKIDDPQAGEQADSHNASGTPVADVLTDEAGDAPSEGRPLLGVSNKNEAIDKLSEAGVDVSELTSKSTVEDIKALATANGFYFPDW